MGNRFDELVYEAVHQIIEQHDEETVSLKADLNSERLANEVLVESIKELRAQTRRFMKDLVYCAFTESPELLRGKIYALVSSFPQAYKKLEEKVPVFNDIEFRNVGKRPNEIHEDRRED